VNAKVAHGHTVLITGIGGGVALLALQLCLALGARVYVTSSSDEKLARAIALGATGGVNYTLSSVVLFCVCVSALVTGADLRRALIHTEDWSKALGNVLGSTLLDSVIDSAGGPIAQQVGRVLRPGGRIVLYGMTVTPQAPFTMREVLRNQQLIG
jgi:NADPH:quinone reductase-like Zn-dependent oxidoreductase